MKEFLHHVAFEGVLPQEIVQKYRIVDLGEHGASLVGTPADDTGRRLSPLGVEAVAELIQLLQDVYPYGTVGLWVYLLAGSKRIPDFRISSDGLNPEALEQVQINLNELAFFHLPPPSGSHYYMV